MHVPAQPERMRACWCAPVESGSVTIPTGGKEQFAKVSSEQVCDLGLCDDRRCSREIRTVDDIKSVCVYDVKPPRHQATPIYHS